MDGAPSRVLGRNCAKTAVPREKGHPEAGMAFSCDAGLRAERYLKEAMALASSSKMSKTVYSLVSCSRS